MRLASPFAINGDCTELRFIRQRSVPRFWQRLLKTAAVEAVAEKPFDKGDELVSIQAVGIFLRETEHGEESVNEITARTHIIKGVADPKLLFETRDMAHGSTGVHRSYST